MKARVNTRFVVLLSSVLVALALVLAGFTWFATRTEPAEFIARGDGLASQGQYAAAADAYARARQARPTDINLILKHAAALQQMPTDNPRAAMGVIRQAGNLYRRALELDATHEQAFAALMDLSMQAGRQLQDPDAWNQMLRVAQAALDARPDFRTAQRYRGIAQVQRMRSVDLDDKTRQQTRDDLAGALEQNPADLEAAVHLAQWCVLEAQRLDRTAPPQAAALRQQARQHTDALLQHHSSDLSARLEAMQMLANLGDQAAANKLLDTLHQELLANPSDVDAVLSVAERLALAEDQAALPNQTSLLTPNLQQARGLLDAAIKAHPQHLPLEVALARVLSLLGEQGQAKALLEPVRGRALKAPAMQLVRLADLQRAALGQLADLHITAATRSDNTAAELAEAAKLIDQIAATTGTIAPVDLLRGKLELARGRFAVALAHLDRASAQFKDAHPETLLLSARARAALGELGAAADRLNRLLALRPQYVPGRVELAGIHLRLGQTEPAMQQLGEVLKLNPQHYEARKLLAGALTQRGKLREAIELYVALDPKTHGDLVVPLAQLYQLTQQPQQAKAVLEQRLATHPADLTALRELLALDGDHSAYLERAQQAGVAADTLNALATLSRGGLPQDPASLLNSGAANDPALAAVMRYQLLHRLGKKDQAAAALAEAVSAGPNHPAVIEASFTDALERGDFKSAEALAQRAATMNLDLAQGAFFQGQLELARGQTAAAIVAFRRGLELRPVQSDGWYRLGEALRISGDHGGAAASFEKALAQKPNHVPALKSLALLADQRGQRPAALEHLRSAVRFAPTDRLLVQQYLGYEQAYGDPQRALALRRELAQADPADTDNLRGLALLLAQLRQHDEAGTLAAQLWEQDRSAANALTAAAVQRLAGKPQRAVAVVQAYLQSRQPAPSTDDWLLAARFHLSLDDLPAAEQAYRQGITQEDAAKRPASRELADVLFARQRYADAAALYQGLWESAQDPAVGLRAAESLLRSGKGDDASALLARVEPRCPAQDASPWLLASMIARSRGDLNGALAALDKALERQPARALVYLERARVKLDSPATVSGALADLDKALELDPDLSSARRLLAQTLLTQGDRDGAARELRSLLQRQPRDIPARRQLIELCLEIGTLLPARTLIREAEALFPDDPQWLRLKAQVATADGKEAEAIEHLKTAFTADPAAAALYDYAAALLGAQRHQEALDLLVEQAELVLTSPVLAALHGRALWTLKRPDDATVVLQQAVAQVKDQAQASAVVSQVLAATGPDHGAAMIDSLAPADAPPVAALLQLALADALLSARQPAQAAERLTALEPTLPVLSRLAMAQHQAGQAKQAAELYRRILQQQPQNVAVLNNLAFLLAEDLNQPAEALPLAQRAAELAPSDAQVLDTLGWTLFKAQQKDQALATLRRSVETQRLAANGYHLAVVLLDRGQRPEALRLLEMAAALARRDGDELLLATVNQRLREAESLSEGHLR